MPLVPENSKGFDDFIKDPTGKEGMRRTAADLGVAGKKWPSADEIKGMIKQGGFADSFNTPIQFLDPAYFDPILFFIQHRDRKELNFRLRYYYEYDEVVGPCIDLHSEFPLSDFHLQCGDQTIQRHFMELKDRIELMNLLTDTAKDYWLLGEAIPYGRWNDSEKTWDFFSLLPPEKVEFRSTYITPNPIIVLQVDDQLKKLVSSQDEIDKAILTMLDPVIVDKIKSETHIVLPQWQVSHFCRKTSRTDLRGTSIVKRALKPLLYKDKLRLLQFTFVDRHMFPLKIFKLGNPQTGWIPTRAHFETLRDLLAQAANDPDFNIIFHHGLQVDYVGTKDKIENLIPHFDWCDAQIMKALFTNKAVVEGQGVTYANANVSVRVLMHRYMTLRSKLELMVNNKIFYQVAKARGYYIPDRTGNTGRQSVNINGKYMILDLPKFRWQKLNLLDDTTQKNFLMRLREKMEIPHKLISEIFDLEESDMRSAMEEEDGTVVDPVYVDARKKTAQQDFVRDQVIRHKKTKDWVLTQSKAHVEKEKPGTKPARETPTQDIETQSVPGEAPVGGGTPPAGEGNSAKPPTETPGGTPPPAAH